MVDSVAARWAVGLGALALVALPAREAAAGGHGGFHGGGFQGGGFHHGGFHGGGFHHGFHGGVFVGFGFGFPGCCWWGAPYAGYSYPGYAYPPVAYAAPPAYVSPTPVASAGAAPVDARECHEYQTTVTIAGRPERAYGMVCRQADGTWRLTAAQ